MKTFDEKDLITWSNRDKAVIGKPYYFGNTVDEIRKKVNRNAEYEALVFIDDSDVAYTFAYDNGDDDDYYFACVLPVDAVKETEPEEKYRACETVGEFLELILNIPETTNSLDEEEMIKYIVDSFVTWRHKGDTIQSTEIVTGIITSSLDLDLVKVRLGGSAYMTFADLFESYEIKISGKWKPFGVLK